MNKFIKKYWLLFLTIIIAIILCCSALYFNRYDLHIIEQNVSSFDKEKQILKMDEKLSPTEFEMRHFNIPNTQEQHYQSLSYYYSLPEDSAESYLNSLPDSAYQELMVKKTTYLDYLKKYQQSYVKQHTLTEETQSIDYVERWIDILTSLIQVLTPLLLPILTYRFSPKYQTSDN